MDYYNEIDKYAAQWIRNLQAAGELPEGPVDERSIEDVQAQDYWGAFNAHFFAGIGGWPLALRLAGWPSDVPVWTGSCPCQPFSTAGKAKGLGDERHLWPAFLRLIAQCRPPVIFGEQVASEDGRYWLAGVRTDLEDLGYAVGAADLCSAGIGAPQIRQRLYWVADTAEQRSRAKESRNGSEETDLRRAHPTFTHRRHTDRFGNSYRVPQSDVPFLADGFPGVLDQIRAAGNAIDPFLAAEFIRAYRESVLDDSAERTR